MGVTSAKGEARISFLTREKLGFFRELRLPPAEAVCSTSAGALGARTLCHFSRGRLAELGDASAQCDTLKHLVEQNDNKEGQEEGVTSHNKGDTNHCSIHC